MPSGSGIWIAAEPLEDGVQLAGARRAGQGVSQRLQLMVQPAELATAGDGLVQHRAAGHPAHVLAVVADTESVGHRDPAQVGGLLAEDEAEQGGLAGAVGPDQPDPLARIDLE